MNTHATATTVSSGKGNMSNSKFKSKISTTTNEIHQVDSTNNPRRNPQTFGVTPDQGESQDCAIINLETDDSINGESEF